ncbi:MAG: dihydrolipoyl dehydrogenase [Gemmataceae bacterium]
MAEILETELIVVGGGPGGYGAAFHAADKGMKVTLVDAGKKPGGTCLHVGCIPSKALLHTAKLITDVRDSAELGLHFEKPRIDVEGVRNYWIKVVSTLANNLLGMCKTRNVEYVNARATFIDSHTIQLDNGAQRRFKHCILATGSSPARPPMLSLDSRRVMDSTGALQLEEIPKSLLVVGGGYIGLEMGYVYAALGSQVTVVELTPGLLPGVDPELVRPLKRRLDKLFHKIMLNTKVVRLIEADKGVQVTLEGEGITEREQTFARVLVAVGRTPNSKNLGLENTKVRVERGFVQVNEQRRTGDEAIYAVGDVAGEPMLAHKATYEGKVAVEAILGEHAVFDVRAIPAVVFTDPEVAWCGLMEHEAKRAGREVTTAIFPWAASGRAATLGRQEGLTKLVVDPETDSILGVGIVGIDAGELIGEGVLAVEMGASAGDLSLSMHPHPTLTETLMEAGELVHGNATDFIAKRRHPAPAKA